MNLPRSNEGRFLLLFFAYTLVGLALLVWRGMEATGSVRDIVLNIAQGMEAVVVVGAVGAYAVVEGGMMLAERYKQRRYEEGREEGLDEALKTLEGIQAQFPNGSDLAKELRQGLERKRRSRRPR